MRGLFGVLAVRRGGRRRGSWRAFGQAAAVAVAKVVLRVRAVRRVRGVPAGFSGGSPSGSTALAGASVGSATLNRGARGRCRPGWCERGGKGLPWSRSNWACA